MNLQQVIQKHRIFQQYHNWYVLDDEFSWNVKKLCKNIFEHLEIVYQTPVVFCTTSQANKIVSDMGFEENEYLRFESAVYWREVGIIFIFNFDDKLELIETLFHEFRHVMQDHNPHIKHYFESDKKLPYQERLTEIDAFHYAKEKTNQYILAI
jgi:hypothetical protein